MLNKHLNLIALMTLVLLLASCDQRKALEKEADERLGRILQLIESNALNAAKMQIDSVHLLYPRLVEKRKIAEAFKDTVTRRESARTLAYCDSILPLKQREADSLRRNFRFEKDAVYQKVGNFIYKTQITEQNVTRTYLKSYVDENADFYLVSHYSGPRIGHTSVQVSVGDVFAQTDTIPLSNAFNHSFSEEGTHWEAVTFKNEADRGVAAFIAQYSASPVKITLRGNKQHAYQLGDADKKAIRETYHLWVVMKDVLQLQKEIKKASGRIERINQRKKDLGNS